MREFSFRAGPGLAVRSWAIRQGHLMRKGASQALKLTTVSKARWQDVSYRGTQSAWLILYTPTETLRLECSEGGESRTIFLELVREISLELARLKPGFTVSLDTSDPARRALFILSACLCLTGLVIAVSALIGALSEARTIWLGLSALLSVSTGALAWRYRPSLSGQAVPAEQFAELMIGLGAPVQTPEKQTGKAE